MTELETLRAFFKAWEELQALPVKKGRPGPEQLAAKDLLNLRANAVRNWKPEGAAQPAPAIDAAAQEYRVLHQQVASIAPKDTRNVSGR